MHPYEHEAFRQAAIRHIIPIPIMLNQVRSLEGKSEEEQKTILDQLANEIPKLYPKRPNPLEGREDVMKCMQKIPAMQGADILYNPAAQPILKEIAAQTLGKTEDQIMHILKRYENLLEQCMIGIDIED